MPSSVPFELSGNIATSTIRAPDPDTTTTPSTSSNVTPTSSRTSMCAATGDEASVSVIRSAGTRSALEKVAPSPCPEIGGPARCRTRPAPSAFRNDYRHVAGGASHVRACQPRLPRVRVIRPLIAPAYTFQPRQLGLPFLARAGFVNRTSARRIRTRPPSRTTDAHTAARRSLGSAGITRRTWSTTTG